MIDSSHTEDGLLEHITRTIVERFHPRRVVLFGSRARGDTHEDSDYDIMVEMESDLSPPHRAMEIDKLFGLRHWSMDVFVYTPAEIDALRGRVGSLVRTIEAEGRVIYEQR